MNLVTTTQEREVAQRVDAPRQTLSLDEAARRLGVSRRTIYNRIRDGVLLTVRTLNGSQRVLLESISGLQQVQAATKEEKRDTR